MKSLGLLLLISSTGSALAQVDNALNASENFRMSAEEVGSTQACELSASMLQRKPASEVVFHEVGDPAHHNEHKICAGAQS